MIANKKVFWAVLVSIGFGYACSSGLAAVTTTGSVSGGRVAYTANGTLTIDGGSWLDGSYPYVGYHYGCTGTATVTGTGSYWTNLADLYVGEYGTGILNIQAGGHVIGMIQAVFNVCCVGDSVTGTGTVTVTGAGSSWLTNSDLTVGNDGRGTVNIQAGGSVDTSMKYKVGPPPEGPYPVSCSTILGRSSGSAGTVTVNGAGSKFSTGGLTVGMQGIGVLNIQAGGQVTVPSLYIGHGVATVTGPGSYGSIGSVDVDNGALIISGGGCVSGLGFGSLLGYNSGSTGTATVAGAGSLWSNSGLTVGSRGKGVLNIQAGGKVATSNLSRIGNGMATVTGAGSSWTSSGQLAVGNSSAIGKLTVADRGQITAGSLSVAQGSSVRLNVAGNSMLVLGNTSTAGNIANNGTISFYASAFLTPGIYVPISEYAGSTITWSGTGSYLAYGGTWDPSAHTFTVGGSTSLAAGTQYAVSSGQSVLFTDSGSGQHVGATFGDTAGDTTFSASVMSTTELNALTLTPGFVGSVVSGWDFDTNLTGSDVLLSFDVGLGAEDVNVWHLESGIWFPYSPDLLTYDSSGIVSFTTHDFSGYAVVEVPEPAALSLVVLGGLALLRRRGK
jgi:T5SS/PEP-CTERM-associated repeat protein